MPYDVMLYDVIWSDLMWCDVVWSGLVWSGLVWCDGMSGEKICSPARSSLQTGRLGIHVNVQNVFPEVRNPADPVGGYQGKVQ